MSPLRHSVISIYAFNQSYIAFLIGCWLPRVTLRLGAVRWKSSYFTHFKRHPGVKQSRLCPISQHSPTFHSVIDNGFRRVLLNRVFSTDLHIFLLVWLEFHTFYLSVHQMLGTYTDDSLIILIYDHMEAFCWRWANSISKYEFQCEGGPRVYLHDATERTERTTVTLSCHLSSVDVSRVCVLMCTVCARWIVMGGAPLWFQRYGSICQREQTFTYLSYLILECWHAIFMSVFREGKIKHSIYCLLGCQMKPHISLFRICTAVGSPLAAFQELFKDSRNTLRGEEGRFQFLYFSSCWETTPG